MSVRAGTPTWMAELRERAAALARARPWLDGEALIAVASLHFVLFDNAAFWRTVVDAPLRQLGWIACLATLMFAVNALLLSALAWRALAKPVIGLLLVVAALASHYARAYGVHIDADMLGNVLHTDLRESVEFVSRGTLWALLSTLPALLLLWRVRLRKRPPLVALGRRLAFASVVLALAVASLVGHSRDLSAMIRNDRATRYLVAPANVLVSLAKLVTQRDDRGPRLQVGGEAQLLARTPGAKPRLLVIVVGETARAANWGLNGYARQTTPELARTPGLFNFPDVTACGSSTEVSLPCMFSVYGREAYDKAAIHGHESLLHLLARAGIPVLWRDNQSGCKGVCDGLPTQRLDAARDPVYCNALRCLDGILLSPASALSGDGLHDQVVVLHMLGNHGPNYNDRVPDRFRRYRPVCESADLGDCSRSEIVNAYDNALLYTDHLLGSAIALLHQRDDYDTALLYVSDHGESLGENGLYLHGMPFAIAPAEQLKVPMVLWLSLGFASATHIDGDCLIRVATRPATHDVLFHSVLGALDVATSAYRADRDVFAACRPARSTTVAIAATARIPA